MIVLSLNNPETLADYEAVITIYNQAWPDNTVTAAEWRHEDKDWPQKYLFQRFVAKEGRDLILEGAVMEPFWMHVPGKYAFFYSPLPAYDECQIDGESIHGRVYAFVVEYLAARKPHALLSTIREDKLARIQWLLENGFQETMREADSRLDVLNFDASPFADVCTRVAAAGVETLTLPELQARDSNWKVKVHKLYNEIELDIIKFIETDNEENNPMYQINMKLGFEPLPAWVDYEKTLG